MKSLLAYINSLPPSTQQMLATRCKTTIGYLRQIAYGKRACPPAMAIDLERESSRAVTCEDLCPVGVDWAYIRAERRRKGPRRTKADRRHPDPVPNDS